MIKAFIAGATMFALVIGGLFLFLMMIPIFLWKYFGATGAVVYVLGIAGLANVSDNY